MGTDSDWVTMESGRRCPRRIRHRLRGRRHRPPPPAMAAAGLILRLRVCAPSLLEPGEWHTFRPYAAAHPNCRWVIGAPMPSSTSTVSTPCTYRVQDACGRARRDRVHRRRAQRAGALAAHLGAGEGRTELRTLRAPMRDFLCDADLRHAGAACARPARPQARWRPQSQPCAGSRRGRRGLEAMSSSARAAPYIGAHVVRLLRQRGDRVVVVDDLSTSNAARIGDALWFRLDVVSSMKLVLHHGDEDVRPSSTSSVAGRRGPLRARPVLTFGRKHGGMANVLAGHGGRRRRPDDLLLSAAVYGNHRWMSPRIAGVNLSTPTARPS